MLIDYHERPQHAPHLFDAVTETLIRWLPSQQSAEHLSHWGLAEWQVAEWITYWQNALPWFVRRLKQADVNVPAPVRQRLLQVDNDCRQRTRLMLDDLAKIVTRLNELQIRVLPLKGAVLAPCYFDDPLLRPLSDLDLFVDRENVDATCDVLRAMGYRFHKRTAKEEVYLTGTRNLHHVWDPANVRPIEVQHQALNLYGGIVYDVAELLWRSAESRVLWNNVRGSVPGKVMLLHHVCAHATEDWLMRRGKLMQIYDIQLLLQQMNPSEWQQLLQTAGDSGARFVYPALQLVVNHTSVDVPQRVLDEMRDAVPSNVIDWLDNVEFSQLFERRERNAQWQELSIGRMLAKSPVEQARVLLRLAFPPRYHFHLKPYQRLVESAYWPLAYVPLNIGRLHRLLQRRTAE